MAQSLFPSSPAALRAVPATHDTQASPLWLEKLGVIAGFLVGLALALGAVQDLLGSSPDWVTVPVAVLTVAASTRLGLMVASILSRRRADS